MTDQKTIDTYNRAAQAYAEKFSGIGPRLVDIERAFAAFGGVNPRVIELGCGDGRDALEICKRSEKYVGIDASKEMITIAKEKAPQGRFVVADITDWEFSSGVEVIFAFASLLHLDRESFAAILKRAYVALSPGGVFHISVKEGDYTGGEIVTDAWGERTFYYYQAADVLGMIDGLYAVMYKEEAMRGHTKWLDVLLQKR